VKDFRIFFKVPNFYFYFLSIGGQFLKGDSFLLGLPPLHPLWAPGYLKKGNRIFKLSPPGLSLLGPSSVGRDFRDFL
jgi:hypothetical protein